LGNKKKKEGDEMLGPISPPENKTIIVSLNYTNL
jgi:hypothetical protein